MNKSAWILFAVTALSTTGHAFTKEEASLDMARQARMYYEFSRKLDEKRPDHRQANAELLKQNIYENFQAGVKKNEHLPRDLAAGVNLAEDLTRTWREIGVNDYLSNPDEVIESYERSAYARCSRG